MASVDPVYGITPLGVDVAIGPWTLCLATLDDDALLDALIEDGEESFDARNPYFGQVWPASVALCEHLVERGRLAARTAIDLGCGPGLVGIVAALLGAETTLADLVPEAVELAAGNARANGVAVEATTLDLRAPGALDRRFDLVLASDVLYEAPLAEDVPMAIATLLAPEGIALVADPLRPHGETFRRAARAAGLEVAEYERAAPGPRGPVRVRVSTLTCAVASTG